MAPTLIIVGASGDLAKRKLFPALEELEKRAEMPFGRVIATSRRVLESTPAITNFSHKQLDLSVEADVISLARELKGDAYVYLSVPPDAALSIAQSVGKHMQHVSLVHEKPFGLDVASAQAEAQALSQYFDESHIYRVDHFLFKRLADEIAGKAQGARRLEIIASEDSRVGARAAFYEKTGALRDFGNHLLSLAMVALGGRVEILTNISLTHAVRAQYDAYTSEIGGASDVETAFALECMYGETTVVLASGKGLATKETVVRIDGTTFNDKGPDVAYQALFTALARKEHSRFLSMPEILESWQIMDTARAHWGPLHIYKLGSMLDDVLKY